MLGLWFFVFPFFSPHVGRSSIYHLSFHCLLASYSFYLLPGVYVILLWENILWIFLISCCNVDSLLFRSAVQLQSWNFFSLDSWVSVTIFLCISYFLGFSLLFCVIPKLSFSGYKIKRSTSWVLLCLKMLLFCFQTWLIVTYVEFYLETKFLSELW